MRSNKLLSSSWWTACPRHMCPEHCSAVAESINYNSSDYMSAAESEWTSPSPKSESHKGPRTWGVCVSKTLPSVHVQFRPAHNVPGSQPNCAKQSQFRLILRHFYPFLGQKYQKKWIWFEDTYPLNWWGVLSWKILVSPFGQFKKHNFCSADMCENSSAFLNHEENQKKITFWLV